MVQILGILLEMFPEQYCEGHKFTRDWLRDECMSVLALSGSTKLAEAFASGAMSGLASALSIKQVQRDAHMHCKNATNLQSLMVNFLIWNEA